MEIREQALEMAIFSFGNHPAATADIIERATAFAEFLSGKPPSAKSLAVVEQLKTSAKSTK